MKSLFFPFVFATSLCFAAVDLHESPEQLVWKAIWDTSQIDDYSQYQELSSKLKMTFSNPRRTEIKEEGTSNPKSLGTQTKLDVSLTRASPLAGVATNPTYSIFRSKTENATRVYFRISVDPEAPCLPEDAFIARFAPVQNLAAPSLGGHHLEKKLEGIHTRYLTVHFGHTGCATQVDFSQSN
jgi:hypothetical protein